MFSSEKREMDQKILYAFLTFHSYEATVSSRLWLLLISVDLKVFQKPKQLLIISSGHPCQRQSQCFLSVHWSAFPKKHSDSVMLFLHHWILLSGCFSQCFVSVSARYLINLHPPLCLNMPCEVFKLCKGKQNDQIQQCLFFTGKGHTRGTLIWRPTNHW